MHENTAIFLMPNFDVKTWCLTKHSPWPRTTLYSQVSWNFLWRGIKLAQPIQVVVSESKEKQGIYYIKNFDDRKFDKYKIYISSWSFNYSRKCSINNSLEFLKFSVIYYIFSLLNFVNSDKQKFQNYFYLYVESSVTKQNNFLSNFFLFYKILSSKI